MAPTPEFCVGSFIGVCWVLSVYLAYHLGRLWAEWKNEEGVRRGLTSLYNSPWFKG